MVNPDDPDYDIYRDSLLRYAGYANEVGEAFRAQESDHLKYSRVPFLPYTTKFRPKQKDSVHKLSFCLCDNLLASS